mmetsp:Transcript_7093/g.15276  ORF Transcript_7093/g.15276 Transcript_7093/m.15276 type:complete len:202 (+) Transcript_7093:672-1277(+)
MPVSRLWTLLSSSSVAVLSRFRTRSVARVAWACSVRRCSVLSAPWATCRSVASTFVLVSATKASTTSRISAACLSSSVYEARTCSTKAAFWAATVSRPVRRWSLVLFIANSTCSFKADMPASASRIQLFTSSLVLVRCAGCTWDPWRALTASAISSRTPFVFLSSPETFAKPVSSPHIWSARAVCCISSPVSFASSSQIMR